MMVAGLASIACAAALFPDQGCAQDAPAYQQMEKDPTYGKYWVYQNKDNAFVLNLFSDATHGTQPVGDRVVDGRTFKDRSVRVLFGDADGLDSRDCVMARVKGDLFNELYDTYQGLKDLGYGDGGAGYWEGALERFFQRQAGSGAEPGSTHLIYIAEQYLYLRGGDSEKKAFETANKKGWSGSHGIDPNWDYSAHSEWSNIVHDTKLRDWYRGGFGGTGDGILGGEQFVVWYKGLNFTQTIPSVDRALLGIRLADLAARIDFWDKLANALKGNSSKANGFVVDGRLSRDEIQCLFESARAFPSYAAWFNYLSQKEETKALRLSTMAACTLTVQNLPNASNSIKALFQGAFDAIQTIHQLDQFSAKSKKQGLFGWLDGVDNNSLGVIAQDDIYNALTGRPLYGFSLLTDAFFM